MSELNYDPDEMMDRKWVADRVKVKPSTLNNWLADKDHPFPKGAKLGDGPCAKRIWRRSVIEDWIAERERECA